MHDLISRQMAIDAFYKYPNINWTTLDVLAEIDDLPSAQPVQQWILCSERLPNEDEISYDGIRYLDQRQKSDRVLAIDEDGYIRTGYFMNSSVDARYGKRFEFGDHYDNKSENWVVGELWMPIAWMPLPGPYIEREQE